MVFNNMNNITHDIIQELHTNFIEYAVAVNTDRAIPDARDGLKPVAKRILYGAYITGRVNSKPHVKSARIVGDVMGTWHPHGDSSIYGAMVRLSQNWVLRYPLIDWHGNNGNIIGDGPAHMRYTEAKLAKISEDGLLTGLKKKNVDFIPNYDETEEEPVALPAIFPNLLCNPNSGIGVAMACNWAPHNLKEVADAIHAYAAGEEPMLPGPDFPTGGIIINKKDIPGIMKTGRGSVKIRSKYIVEKNTLVFYEIPYGTTIENLIAEIGEVCNSKEVEGVTDIRDESNKKGLRLIVECDKNINPHTIANKLFAKTNLQSSFAYNQVALINKTPTEMNLKDCIKIYMEHNVNCLIKETRFDLQKAKDRLHIVNGLLAALEDIDNIIALIKTSDSSAAAKVNLMKKYEFTEAQAKAILAMRLSSLAKLEAVELNKEKEGLTSDIESFNNILANQELQKEIVLNRLDILVTKYGDARKTELQQIEIPKEEKEIVEVIPEDVVIIVSQNGEIKRIPRISFKTQRRNGKGVKTLENSVLASISTNTIDTLMIFTSKGKMYRLLVDKVPVGTNSSVGVSLHTLLKMDSDEAVVAATSLYRKTNAEYVVFFTKNGLIKKTPLKEYIETKKTTGIQAIKFKDGDELVGVTFLKDENVIVLTKKGYSIFFDTINITPTGRVTSGVKAIKLVDDEVILGLPIKNVNESLAIFTERGMGKKTSLKDFPYQARGGRGVIAYKVSPISGNIIGGAIVDDNDEILLLGKPSSICISSKDIPQLGRTGLGNIMIKNSTLTKVVKL